jgi:hypothetical protein
MTAKLGEIDAAWIAAARAGFCAEVVGSPLAVAASMFRIAHVFLALGQVEQAQHVATDSAQALEPKITGNPSPETLSLYGAFHLVLVVAVAHGQNSRTLITVPAPSAVTTDEHSRLLLANKISKCYLRQTLGAAMGGQP